MSSSSCCSTFFLTLFFIYIISRIVFILCCSRVYTYTYSIVYSDEYAPKTFPNNCIYQTTTTNIISDSWKGISLRRTEKGGEGREGQRVVRGFFVILLKKKFNRHKCVSKLLWFNKDIRFSFSLFHSCTKTPPFFLFMVTKTFPSSHTFTIGQKNPYFIHILLLMLLLAILTPFSRLRLAIRLPLLWTQPSYGMSKDLLRESGLNYERC